jgi:ligand-binding SRPBCC domain-containing protein
MPGIHLTTLIHAPIQRVFDLSRSISLHKNSMEHTKEEAIAGRTSGLIELNETVTWRARHLGKTRILQSKITGMERPVFFCDEMVEGDFKRLRHEHHFKSIENGTIMIDLMDFESPYGALGRLFNHIYLTKYLRHLLQKRNAIIKKYAESNQWKHILEPGINSLSE